MRVTRRVELLADVTRMGDHDGDTRTDYSSRTPRPGVVLLVALAILCPMYLLLPSAARASEPQLVAHSETTVSGLDAARVLLQGVEHVEIGSSGATLTMDFGGTTQPVGVSYAGALGGTGGGSGWTNVFSLGILGVAVVNVARIVARITRPR